jgi:hypothetical protein
LRDYGLFWKDPHTYRGVLKWTDFEVPIFLDWLRDAEIPLPPDPENDRSWDGWWEEQRESLTCEQLSHFFAGLHKLSFHEIVEVDLIEDEAWDPLLAVGQETGVTLTGVRPAAEFEPVETTDEEVPLEDIEAHPADEESEHLPADEWRPDLNDEIPF